MKHSATRLPLIALTLLFSILGLAGLLQRTAPFNAPAQSTYPAPQTTPHPSSQPTASTSEDLAFEASDDDLWPELDQLLAELQAEQLGHQINQPSEDPAPHSVPESDTETYPDPQPSLEPLIEASSATWLTSSLEQRLLNSLAMLTQIFKQDVTGIQLEHVQSLESCISAAAAENDLGELQVKELAAACALALNWR